MASAVLDTVSLKSYSNEFCDNSTANTTTVWEYTRGECVVLDAGENTFVNGDYHTSKPTISNVVTYDYFSPNICQAGTNYRQRGNAACRQTQTPTGPVWISSECEILNTISSKQCFVSTCRSSCLTSVTHTPMFQCVAEANFPSFNSSGWWSTCSVASNQGGGLTGVLPPPNGAAQIVVSWAMMTIVASLFL